MAVDEQLLAVQQWLNETYGKVPGYIRQKKIANTRGIGSIRSQQHSDIN
ncbi:Uncharacterised protein [Listeria fleischmannii subsp. coloradonensis]|nr:Uncharacterised protein [Listeria fleischmannii subsp. coloradonensis]